MEEARQYSVVMIMPSAIQRLVDEMSCVRLDLKDAEQWNVAPGREEVAARLLRVGLSRASFEDLDYALFKSMTTMGGVDTFKAVLPWFLAAATRDPNSVRLVDLQILIRKLQDAGFGAWPESQREATLEALVEYRGAVASADPEEPTLAVFDLWVGTQDAGTLG